MFILLSDFNLISIFDEEDLLDVSVGGCLLIETEVLAEWLNLIVLEISPVLVEFGIVATYI